MLYIKKKSPPSEMLRKVSEIKSTPEWKKINVGDTRAIRDQFEALPKDAIRKSLLEEQHYLCAYCMHKIENNPLRTSIEHWYPLSKDKEMALDYNNMLAVCDGGENWKGKEKKNLCCDAFKADEAELKISPLNKRQMEKITYTKDGFIKTEPQDQRMDEEIRDVLRLNGIWKNDKFLADTTTGLVKGRKDAYQRYEDFIKRLGKKGRCTSAQVKKKIDEIKTADEWLEYAGVILYFLNKKYQSLVKRGL